MNRRRFLKQAGLWVPASIVFPAIVHAQRSPFSSPSKVAIIGGSVSTTPAITYLVEENCEGASTPTGWTDNASPTWHYSTSPAPLQGSFSVMTNAIGGESRTSFTAQNDVWAFCYFNLSARSSNHYFFQLRDSTDAAVTGVKCQADGTMSLVNFATTVTTGAGAITGGVTYYLWMHYIKGSGSDSTSEAYLSTTTSKPVSPTVSFTNGGSTTQASRIAFMGWNDANFIFDRILVSASSIPSNP